MRSRNIKIVEREQHRCAITNWFDLTYVVALLGAGRQDEIPKGLQCIAKVAHIIPFMLNNYAKKRLNENAAPEEVCSTLPFLYFFLSFAIERCHQYLGSPSGLDQP